jgi:hypothetical protein
MQACVTRGRCTSAFLAHCAFHGIHGMDKVHLPAGHLLPPSAAGIARVPPPARHPMRLSDLRMRLSPKGDNDDKANEADARGSLNRTKLRNVSPVCTGTSALHKNQCHGRSCSCSEKLSFLGSPKPEEVKFRTHKPIAHSPTHPQLASCKSIGAEKGPSHHCILLINFLFI